MKRWIIIAAVVVLLAVPAFFIARHLNERGRQSGNVRHDAEWFVTALKIGNERAATSYLSRTKMDSVGLEKALQTHTQSLLTTGFDTAPLSFRSEGSLLLATFLCSSGAAFTFYTEDGGDVWWIYDLKSP